MSTVLIHKTVEELKPSCKPEWHEAMRISSQPKIVCIKQTPPVQVVFNKAYSAQLFIDMIVFLSEETMNLFGDSNMLSAIGPGWDQVFLY